MRLVNAADPRVTFAKRAEWPDDGRRYEVYDGEVIVVPTPFLRHQRVAHHLGMVLTDGEGTTGGLVCEVPIDIVFSEYDVLQPDVVFFRKERRHLLEHDGTDTRAARPCRGNPVPEHGTARSRTQDADLRAIRSEYWIVDPVGNTVEIYELSCADYRPAGAFDQGQRVASPTLPGLSFDAGRIFEE
jgi:Uma2 family endonuclease